MDKALEEKISDILASPEELKKIINIASTLGFAKGDAIETDAKDVSDDSEKSTSESQSSERGIIESLLQTGKIERTDLLNALKPYLNESKREKLESLIRILNAIELLLSVKEIF